MIPKQYIETLKDIQFIWPTAVLAGGCIRDSLYGKEVKDVDIFIQTDDMNPSVRGLELALGCEIECLTRTTATEEYEQFMEETDRQLIDIYRFYRGGVEHQLIFLRPDEKMVEKFDLSFCQVLFDGKHMTSTLAFEKTLDTKVVTLGEGRPMTPRIGRRVERFKVKFPELTFPEIKTGTLI